MIEVADRFHEIARYGTIDELNDVISAVIENGIEPDTLRFPVNKRNDELNYTPLHTAVFARYAY